MTHDLKLHTRRLFLLSGAACLTLPVIGCAITAAPRETFDLSAAQTDRVRRASSRTLVITRPISVQTYETERVVVRSAGGVLSYLPKAQWSDSLPVLIQTRLLETFENAAFKNVGRPSDQLSVDVTLATEIRAFEIDTTSTPPQASVKLSAKLVNERRGSIFASAVFSATVPLQRTVDVCAIASLDSALHDVALQLLSWSAKSA